MDETLAARLAEHARREARSVRDDHADGARCEECYDGGCPRVTTWWPMIMRMNASLDDYLD